MLLWPEAEEPEAGHVHPPLPAGPALPTGFGQTRSDSSQWLSGVSAPFTVRGRGWGRAARHPPITWSQATRLRHGLPGRSPGARLWGLPGSGSWRQAGPTRSAPGSRLRPARAPPPAHRVPSPRRRPEPRGRLSLGAPGAGRPHGADGAARTLKRPRSGLPRRARGSRARRPAAFGPAWEP